MNPRCRIVVLLSGEGSNLQALIESVKNQDINGDIVAVLSNRPAAGGLNRAEKAGIPAHCIDHKSFDHRESFDREMIQQIDAFQPTLVVLAGFMRILTAGFVNDYLG